MVYTIFVKQLTGVVLTFTSLTPSDDIAKLRGDVSSTLNIPRNHLRLIFAGKQLEDGRTFADYCIQKESTLHIVIRTSGGGEREEETNRKAKTIKLSHPWKPIH